MFLLKTTQEMLTLWSYISCLWICKQVVVVSKHLIMPLFVSMFCAPLTKLKRQQALKTSQRVVMDVIKFFFKSAAEDVTTSTIYCFTAGST